jgi:cysteinyl-tRNA synthetase
MIHPQIFNTLTKRKEDFRPIVIGKVTFYHCGPTVYWTQHIGNLRGMTMGDLTRRTLAYLDYDVSYVRNYTDVGHLTGDNIGDADSGEDRMAKGARREGLTPDQIADKYIRLFEEDTEAINLLEPTAKTRATHFIPGMIEMVQTLLDKGFAYPTPQAIYFDVTKAKDYTRLSGQKLEENKLGAGKGDVQDSQKRNPADFSLWFFKTGAHKDALQTWPSPFSSPEVENGQGFPGWHLECSVMAKDKLGLTLDIHMGGIEHIPVHHTNEIAQSESANAVPYVNYWMHNEHLLVDGKKMAKSEGTGYVLQDIIDKGFSPLALRYFFLSAHYRSKQNFTWEGLQAAQTAYDRLIGHLVEYKNFIKDQGVSKNADLEVWRMNFVEQISDDFNIPAALAVVWDLINSDAEPADKYHTIMDFDRVLGLDLERSVNAQIERQKLSPERTEQVEDLIAKRNEARNNKDWKRADELREKLLKEFNVEIKDADSGTTWRVVINAD